MNNTDIPIAQPTPYEEERRKLADTLTEIEQQRTQIGPVYYGKDYVEQLLEARREETRQRLDLLGKEPYFGRLDFRENGQPSPHPLYIG
jgi:DNA helicase-2/ATP-dependent DNA helicase PcrA